jgi:hypothetical protein
VSIREAQVHEHQVGRRVEHALARLLERADRARLEAFALRERPAKISRRRNIIVVIARYSCTRSFCRAVIDLWISISEMRLQSGFT